MSTQSSIPGFAVAFIAALAAQLATDGLSAVPVSDGYPPPSDIDTPLWAAVTETDTEVQVRALNRTTQPRNERYKQHVLISSVVATAADQTSAVNAAFTVYDSIHALLRANWALDGFYTGPGHIIAAKVESHKLTRHAQPESREAALEVVIDVEARL